MWMKLWGWFTANPIAQFIGAVLLALIGWNVVRRNIEETGRIKERERMAAAQARENTKIAQARNQITQEITEDARRADEAVAAVRDSAGPSELRNDAPTVANELLGRTRQSPR